MRLAFVLTMALALAPVGAQAQRGAKGAPALIKEGERLYQAGKFREAAEVLQKAHDAAPHPRLIFNIAVAYENAGDLREALTYYQQYANSPEGTDPALLKRSARSISKLQVLLEKEQQTAAAAEAERKRLEEEALAANKKAEEEQLAARRAEEAAAAQAQADYERQVKSYKRSKIAAFTFGGVALASAGAGVFLGLQAREARTTFDGATSLDLKRTAAEDTRGKALLADIGFGVGIASALTAIILYPKDGPPVEGEVRMTVAPRGAGAGMEVSF